MNYLPIVVLALAAGLVLLAIWWLTSRSFPPYKNSLVGIRCQTVSRFMWSGDGHRGNVVIDGETRSAVSPHPLTDGQQCQVTRDGRTTLVVEPCDVAALGKSKEVVT